MSDYKNGTRRSNARVKSPYSHEALLNFLLCDLRSSGLPIHEGDIATMLRRYHSEGPQFAYRTLKGISDMVLHVLEHERLPASVSFTTLQGTMIPKLFGDLWLAFVDKTGLLRPDIQDSEHACECIAALLQIGSLLSKYEESFPKELIPQYIDDFVSTDDALARVNLPDDLMSAAANLITEIFKGFSLKDISPKHGPGAVANGERGEQKWVFKRLYDSLHQAYPYYHYMVVGGARELKDRLPWYTGLERVKSGTAKIMVVPKSATSLRVISMEPLEIQFIQQGQMTLLVRHLQRHPLTKGHVNFDDQTINGNLALVNSRTRELATIDLSAASDRLSLELVKRLFVNEENNVLRYLLASRSTHTTLPNGDVVALNKFAPMGSAVCFPVQSVIFYALCVAAISIATKASIHQVRKSVYVFGDDIIIPSHTLDCVAEALSSVGLKVNLAKSFSEGFFRESCGVFAFAGKDVTPLRVKTSFPTQKGDGRGISAWISYAHACERRGYDEVAEYIYSTIESLTGNLPYGYSSSSYFCRLAQSDSDLAIRLSEWPDLRWNESLQRIEIKALGPSNRLRDVEFQDGWHRLFRDVTVSYVDADPTKVVVPRSTRTKAGWHPIL